MKKSVVLILVLIFAVGVAATGLAASDKSFSDVPLGHWAYDSVIKLAKAGLIEGYSDNTFHGDRTISRYEFAFITARALDNYQKADAENRRLIDTLSAEFNTELNRLNARIAKVEAKQNTWVSGDTRFRFVSDSPSAAGAHKVHGSDNFDWRTRVNIFGNINDQTSYYGRFTTTGANKFGNYQDNTAGSVVAVDLAAMTMNNFMGLDKVRIGRWYLDEWGNGLMGKAIGVDGVRIDKKFGNVKFIGSVNNVKGNTNTGTGTGDSGNANTMTTATLGFKLSDNLNIYTGYYRADVPGTSTSTGMGTLNTNVGSFNKSAGWGIGFNTIIWDKYRLFGDYLATNLYGVTGIPGNPRAWAIELTNSLYCPPVYYNALNLVDPKRPGTDAWMISYRSLDAGSEPSGAGGYDTMGYAYASDPYSVYTHGSDNVNVLFLAYQKVIFKGIIASLEYQDFKIKDRSLTSLTSSQLNKIFTAKLEYFY